MNSDINQETMKKIAWGAAVVLLTAAAFLFFWKGKYGKEWRKPEITEIPKEESEKDAAEREHKMMTEGYIWALHGEIKSFDLEKGLLEVETAQLEEKKIFQVAIDSKTELVRVIQISQKDEEGGKLEGKVSPEEAAGQYSYSEEVMKTDKNFLAPGKLVQIEAPEMFLLEKDNSIQAKKITFFESQ